MEALLKSGLVKLDINATDKQIVLLIQFINLLLKWNKVYNLTAIRIAEEAINLHILDSLSVLPYVKNCQSILDVGSGAGLPGIPLAIFCPDVEFVLLDGNGKKTRFINQASIELSLKNVKTVHSRVEKFQPDKPFDCITTRAFASIIETLDLIDHLVSDKSKLICMKANTVTAELDHVSDDFEKEVIELNVPGIDAPRTLAVLTRKFMKGV